MEDVLALRQRVAELEERIRQLTALLAPPGVQAPREWRLTNSEHTVFQVLVARPVATKEMILAALYWDKGLEEPELKIIDVFICKLRKKLSQHGVAIATVWGRGWSMPEDVRRRFIQEAEAADTRLRLALAS